MAATILHAQGRSLRGQGRSLHDHGRSLHDQGRSLMDGSVCQTIKVSEGLLKLWWNWDYWLCDRMVVIDQSLVSNGK